MMGIPMSERAAESNKDEPLRDDIRLLGRILGDTVREQEGDSVYELVERVRQTAVRFHLAEKCRFQIESI